MALAPRVGFEIEDMITAVDAAQIYNMSDLWHALLKDAGSNGKAFGGPQGIPGKYSDPAAHPEVTRRILLASQGRLLNLGLTTYQDACEVQLRLHEACAVDQIDDVLILTEHFSVYTLGRTTRPEHVKEGRNETRSMEFPAVSQIGAAR